MTAPAVVMVFQLAQQSESLFVGVRANHSAQVWVEMCQRDDHQRGQTSQEAAVKPEEGVAQVANG